MSNLEILGSWAVVSAVLLGLALWVRQIVLLYRAQNRLLAKINRMPRLVTHDDLHHLVDEDMEGKSDAERR